MPMDAAMGTVTVMMLSAGLLVLGFILGWLISSKAAHSKVYRAELSAETIVEDAQKEAEAMKHTAILEAKDQIHQERLQFEQELETQKDQAKRTEVKLSSLERQLDKRADLLNHKEKLAADKEQSLAQEQEQIEQKTLELEETILEQNRRLEQIAGLTRQEAKNILMGNLEEEARRDAEWRMKEIRDDALARANDEAREIISSAIQRLAADHTIESTVAMVKLPSDEMKGRIIGREGRNIRAFEMATGVDVTIDDTPEAVVLSGFDPIRRAVAKSALEQLILDGRIHPGRIEEIVEKSSAAIQEMIREAGEQAAFDVGLPGLHDRLIECLGRLRFRTSYGQNVLNHSKEVAFLTGMMATSLGLDAQIAKRAGLLHDIGKGLTHEAEGTYGENGADLARKFGENPIVINAIEAHHGDADPTSPIAVLVDAADTISRSRPGAQREVLENYVRRLERLESIAKMIDGVQSVYAIKAGQEVRVMADCEMMSDADTEKLAAQIVARLSEDVTCPGPVKVTVIRETRAVDFAR
ncbi:MAG: ribonuclease Y [bacterium]|nr:ribonuclease Y [bacterium]